MSGFLRKLGDDFDGFSPETVVNGDIHSSVEILTAVEEPYGLGWTTSAESSLGLTALDLGHTVWAGIARNTLCGQIVLVLDVALDRPVRHAQCLE